MMSTIGYITIVISLICLMYHGVTSEEEGIDNEASNDEKINNRPVIGILSLAITDKTVHKYWPYSKSASYIAGSYAKLIESAGARAVPISDRFDKGNLTHGFLRLSGLLLPGGEVNLEDSNYKRAASILLDLAKKANDDGIYFPVLGICRGAQALAVIAADDLDILQETDSKNVSLPVKLVKDYRQSKLLENIGVLTEIMEKQSVTSHFHKYGIDPKLFEKNKKLKETFKLLGTSKDRKGKEFASIFEDKKYPFYGLQFHPEKPIFEWSPYINVDHSQDSVLLGQYFANFFISEARRNVKHRYGSYAEEVSWGIEKYPLTYTAVNVESSTPFDTIYML